MSHKLIPRVIKVIAETRRIPAEQITADSTFEELGIDSLDGIQLLFGLENEFGMDLPDDAAREVKGVRDLAEGIARLIAEKEAAAGSGVSN